ncbi:hypothetical protein ACH427_23005 [Streptomyces sp. NPDC020379]|uniref:hypothetical protein n=1 Tax=Streptomyces sp. NPDC020379 TaxID=3365071 RepID=UPI0037BBE9C3
MLVLAGPHSTLNTGVVHGDQRNAQYASSTAGDGPPTRMRQGPVRAKELQDARRRFIAPAAFEEGLAALGSGILLLVGMPGTGRFTLALNLLAHGFDDPALVQVDGAVDLARWRPRSQGVHGYLVMEPGDPFALKPWDFSHLEGLLATAGARLIIVLPESPGLVRALERDFGAQVVHHEPPDPGDVFSAHFADICPDMEVRARLLEPLGPEFLSEILPPELPPGCAAQAARTVACLGVGGAVDHSEVLSRLASTEAPEVLARAEGDPEVLAHLLSVCVYGGLDRATIVERAADLLALAGNQLSPEPDNLPDPAGKRGHGLARQRSLRDILRSAGARCEARGGGSPGETVTFLWPALREAVWDLVCREHTGLLPLLHDWLGKTGHDEEGLECAGRAVTEMAVRTRGQTFGLIRELALSSRQPGVDVAARALGAAVLDATVADKAYALLQEWSNAPEVALRATVVHACRSGTGDLGAEQALALLRSLVDKPGDDADDMAVTLSVSEVLVQRFEAGDPTVKETIVRHLAAWTQNEDVADLLAAIAFPLLVERDWSWFGGQLLLGGEAATRVAELVWHALNEATTYHSMRDTLLVWCRETEDAPQPDGAVEELFARLVDARQPGFLRLLLSIERGGDAMPGRQLAERSLTEWRGKSPARESE